MNIITNAIKDLKFRIPAEILNLAFTVNNFQNDLNSLDELIMSNVIRARVLKDCNILDGRELRIRLDSCITRVSNPNFVVIEVPKKLTGNRSILDVHSLTSSFTHGVGRGSHAGIGGDLMLMGNAVSSHNVLASANLELVGENLILINEEPTNLIGVDIKVEIENNINLSNFGKKAYLNFSELCLRAVKAYIYNKLVIMLDKGYIASGHELGVVKDIVDEYKDYDELYLEYLTTTWAKVSFSNDTKKLNTLIGDMFGV